MSYSSAVADPNYEWHELRRLCDPEPRLIRGRCLHLAIVPVESIVTGETLCHLCTVCDTQILRAE